MSALEDGLSEEAGEGYFASISDLMVGVLFVFLLMLTVFALNYHDDSAALDELIRREKAAEQRAARLRLQNEQLRARLAEAAAALRRELANREAARADLLARLGERLQAAGIRFSLDPRSGVLRLTDAIPFSTGRSDVTDPRGRETLDGLGRILMNVLPCFATGYPAQGCKPGDGAILETVLIEGHTDTQSYLNLTPLQSEQENDRLSAARALTVFTSLRQAQPDLDRLRNPADQPLLGISGYGQRRPLQDARSGSEADLTRNRRIDLRFVLSSRPSSEIQALISQIDALQSADP